MSQRKSLFKCFRNIEDRSAFMVSFHHSHDLDSFILSSYNIYESENGDFHIYYGVELFYYD